MKAAESFMVVTGAVDKDCEIVQKARGPHSIDSKRDTHETTANFILSELGA